MKPERAEEQIRRGLTAAPPSLERCEEVVRCAEQRDRRAAAKRDAAVSERIAAMIAKCHARAARSHFIANNPDDQMVLL